MNTSLIGHRNPPCHPTGAPLKKKANSANTTGMDLIRMLLCICTHHPWMQRHTTSYLENKIKEYFQWWSGGWEAGACTISGVLLRHLWGLTQHLCSMSRLIYMSLLRIWLHVGLVFTWVMWHVEYLQGCGVGPLCVCCRWCLLLPAVWSEGFYCVWVSEASTAYVALVPSLLVE